MIVTDSSVIVHAIIDTDCSIETRAVGRIDADWHAPILWISELRSAILKYMRIGRYSIAEADEFMRLARRLMQAGTGTVGDDHVLRLAVDSGCSTYDCEFVAMAQQMDAPLLTYDRKLLNAFPELAVTPSDWLERNAG